MGADAQMLQREDHAQAMSSHAPQGRFWTAGPIALDREEQSVTLDGQPVALTAKGVKALECLMASTGGLVTKAHLIDCVWDGRAVSDSVVTTAVKEIRRALRDSARQPRYVRTVHGRGYRFLLDVTRLDAPPSTARQRALPKDKSATQLGAWIGGGLAAFAIAGLVVLGVLTLSQRPSTEAMAPSTAPDVPAVAILPFQNLNPAAEASYLSNGVHYDLIGQLSRLASLKVISRGSTLRYRDADVNIAQVARDLGVSAVLAGSILLSDDRLEIQVRLIDAVRNTPLWAERFERALTSQALFDVQADITRRIAGALQARLSKEENAQLDKRPTMSLAAHEAFVQANLLFDNGDQSDWQDAALTAINRAIELDPNFAQAYAKRAHMELAMEWYDNRGDDWIARAAETIERAKDLAPNAVETRIAEAYYRYWGLRDYAGALDVLDRAHRVAPNHYEVWEVKAYVARRTANFDTCLEALRRARRLNPLDSEIATELAETLVPFGRFGEADFYLDEARDVAPLSGDLAVNVARRWEYAGDLERAYAAITGPMAGNRSFHAFEYAWMLRDTDKVEEQLAVWRKRAVKTQEDRTTTQIMEAKALIMRGDHAAAAAILDELQAQADAGEDLFPAAWAPNAWYFPAELAGLRQDLNTLRPIVSDYEAQRDPDVWQAMRHYYAIAQAFARVGDPTGAMDYVDRYEAIYGPSIYLRVAADPAFASIRSNPRFTALEARFQNWKDAQDD